MSTRTPDERAVSQFRELLSTRIGFRLDEHEEVLQELLESGVSRLGLSVEEYLGSIDDAELGEIARRLTVSETYFMRNAAHFEAFCELLRVRAATGEHGLRVLSVGCSSGEEAYSVAICAREIFGELGDEAVEILGIDINPDMVEKARRARYSKWSLRAVDPDIQTRYLPERRDGFEVVDEITRHVRFECRNIFDANAIPESARFDVIFCRNMIMYFTIDAARDVIARLSAALRPGGYLFLGHAENLRGLSRDFHLCHTHRTFYYQRHDGEEASPVVRSARRQTPSTAPLGIEWMQAIAESSERIETLARPRPAQRSGAPAPSSKGLAPAYSLVESERFEDALQILGQRRSSSDPEALLLRASILSSSGRPEEAEQVCQELLHIDELNSGAHYITALCREHVGDIEGAITHSRAAVYLDPSFAMPHLQMGILARRRNDLGTARRELADALDLLARESSARLVLFGGGFGRDAIMELCRAELNACGRDDE